MNGMTINEIQATLEKLDRQKTCFLVFNDYESLKFVRDANGVLMIELSSGYDDWKTVDQVLSELSSSIKKSDDLSMSPVVIDRCMAVFDPDLHDPDEFDPHDAYRFVSKIVDRGSNVYICTDD
jgi:hypothetical protein